MKVSTNVCSKVTKKAAYSKFFCESACIQHVPTSCCLVLVVSSTEKDCQCACALCLEVVMVTCYTNVCPIGHWGSELYYGTSECSLDVKIHLQVYFKTAVTLLLTCLQLSFQSEYKPEGTPIWRCIELKRQARSVSVWITQIIVKRGQTWDAYTVVSGCKPEELEEKFICRLLPLSIQKALFYRPLVLKKGLAALLCMWITTQYHFTLLHWSQKNMEKFIAFFA